MRMKWAKKEKPNMAESRSAEPPLAKSLGPAPPFDSKFIISERKGNHRDMGKISLKPSKPINSPS